MGGHVLTPSLGYTRSEPRPSLHRFGPRSFISQEGRAHDLTHSAVFCRRSLRWEPRAFCTQTDSVLQGIYSRSMTSCPDVYNEASRRGGVPSSTVWHQKALGTKGNNTTRTGQSSETKKSLRHRAVHYFDACTNHQTTLRKSRYHIQAAIDSPVHCGCLGRIKLPERVKVIV